MGTFGSQVKSITVDHGKEFADYQTIEQGGSNESLFLPSIFTMGTGLQ